MDRILGQPAAARTLQSAVDSGRVHHAWIFHGPHGVGKSTAAREFAKLLLDPETQRDLAGSLSVDPGGRIARMVDDESHPDLHIIRKEMALYSSDPRIRSSKQTTIAVDVLREFMIGGVVNEKFHDAMAYQSPAFDHGKVFIIEEADMMDKSGQNAILKTLEEPSPGTVIILVTMRPERLLPTIRSRCQSVPFTRLNDDAMQTWMSRWDAEVSEEELAWIYEFADGSPGYAEIAAKDGLFAFSRDVLPMLRDLDAGRFPPALGETLSGFVEAYSDAWVKKFKEASKEIAKGAGCERVFLVLAWAARTRIEREAVEGGDAGVRMADAIRDAEYEIARHVNMKMVFEDLAAQWAHIVSDAQPQYV